MEAVPLSVGDTPKISYGHLTIKMLLCIPKVLTVQVLLIQHMLSYRLSLDEVAE